MGDRHRHLITAAFSMLAGATLQYLYALSGSRELMLYLFSTAAVGILFLVEVFLVYQRRRKSVQYSVLLFAVNSRGELLVTYNPHHRRSMVPCGNIPPNRTPGEAARIFLREQAGLEPEAYQPLFTRGGNPCCQAQIEFVTRHERRVREHYAFVFFYRLLEEPGAGSGARLCSLADFDAMPPELFPYRDIYQRYAQLLKEGIV